MVNELMVELSRWQFAATSLYHFIFVPLTLGISWLVFIMELVYVATNRVIYRDMAKFWGKLFAINFAIGVATGITLEFEFGTNWSNYSHYVGDIFGAPLAIEGLMAFFLESTFIGLMFTGWQRFSKKTHLVITFLTALGSNLSAMWILIANGWMQYPEFAQFSPERLRMEMVDFWGLVFSEVAQVKFVHTVTAGYITAGVFVIGVSAFLMLKRQSLQFAKRSMTIALVFVFAALGASGLSGDLSALAVTKHQPAKLAAMEAEYETQTPPASWSVFAIPSDANMENYLSIKVPALLGLIATHSLDTEVKGLRDIVAENELRVRNGALAFSALTKMREGDKDPALLDQFKLHQEDLGYGMLLVQYAKDPFNPTEEEIKLAARNSVPPVAITYYAFRVMLGVMGIVGLLCAVIAFFLWFKRDLHTRQKLLKYTVYAIVLPFIACEAGWIVAEIGRQPWAIQEVLPTFMATSTLSAIDVGISLLCFIGIYTTLLIIEMKLMVKAIKKGPDLTDPEPEGKGYPPLPPEPEVKEEELKEVEAVATSEATEATTEAKEEGKCACECEAKAEEAKAECECAKDESKTCECEAKAEEAKAECECKAEESKICECAGKVEEPKAEEVNDAKVSEVVSVSEQEVKIEAKLELGTQTPESPASEPKVEQQEVTSETKVVDELAKDSSEAASVATEADTATQAQATKKGGTADAV